MGQTSTDNWDHFTGSNFLKVTHVKDVNDAFVVLNVEVYEDEDKNAKPRLTMGRGEEEFLFDLNVTNSNFCKNEGKIKTPRELIGKKIFFKKVNVISPKTKKEVESLRIIRIE